MLARATLAAIDSGDEQTLDVVVGGLGLGYTLPRSSPTPGSVGSWWPRSSMRWSTGIATARSTRRSEARARWATTGSRSRSATYAPPYERCRPASVDVILLDVDNGPGYLVYDANAAVYRDEFLQQCGSRLRKRGVAGSLVGPERAGARSRRWSESSAAPRSGGSRSSWASAQRRTTCSWARPTGRSRDAMPGDLVTCRTESPSPSASCNGGSRGRAGPAVSRSTPPTRGSSSASTSQSTEQSQPTSSDRARFRPRRPAGRRSAHRRRLGASVAAAQPRGRRAAAGRRRSGRPSRRHRRRGARPKPSKASQRRRRRIPSGSEVTSRRSAESDRLSRRGR